MLSVFITYILFFLLYKNLGWRVSWVCAAIAWSFTSFLMTEVISMRSSMSATQFLLIRSILNMALILLIYKKYLLRRTIHSTAKNTTDTVKTFLRLNILILIPILYICSLTFFIAVKSPPNTWDAMTYHLSRIEHWMQNRNINHYPTHNERQLYMSPFAEIAILQIKIFGNSENYINLIQWFSMIGSIVCVSLIAKEFGLNMKLQLIASAIACMIPAGILQSSSSQNDYVVSFFILCFVYFSISKMKDQIASHPLLLGVAIGLAVLTKPTAYMYLLPFVFWYFIKEIHSHKLYIILLIAISINLFNFSRQYQVYKNIFGPESEKYRIGTVAPKYLIVNAMKNISMHVGTPFESMNKYTYAAILKYSNTLHVDINDSRISWLNEKFRINPLSTNEDYVGNLLHLLLAIIVSIYIIFGKVSVKKIRIYTLLSWIGFALTLSLLRWQPWSARFHLPFFLFMTPIVALLLSQLSVLIRYVIIAILLTTSLYWVYMNDAKGILAVNSILKMHRDEIMFTHRPELKESYSNAIEYIKMMNYRKIGLYNDGDAWEYPLWIKLYAIYGNSFELRHINVSNASSTIRYTFIPDIILCIPCVDSKYSQISVQKIKFDQIDTKHLGVTDMKIFQKHEL